MKRFTSNFCLIIMGQEILQMYVYLISYVLNAETYYGDPVRGYYGMVFSTKAKAQKVAEANNLGDYKIVAKKVH